MSNQLSLRRAHAGDESALALVGQATFLETFSGTLEGGAIVEHCQRAHSAVQYGRWLGDPRVAIWLALVAPGDAPVGYMIVAPPELPLADPSRDLELKRIYLMSRYQGSGLGKRLLTEAVDHARASGAARLLLGVYAGNASAIGFYRRHGFEHLTDRKFVVGNRSYDDHVMSLQLTSADGV